jgi:hypothetical protein
MNIMASLDSIGLVPLRPARSLLIGRKMLSHQAALLQIPDVPPSNARMVAHEFPFSVSLRPICNLT